MPAGRGRGTWALVGLALLVALASCTSDDGPDAATTTTSTTTTTGPDAQTMRLGIGGDLIVDPVERRLASPRDLMVIDLLHDGLTRLDDAGRAAARPRRPGGRATSTTTAFRFHLDREATFASGRPVTPEDVIALARADHRRRATRRWPRCRSRRSPGFRAFVEGEADHVSGLHGPDDAHRPHRPRRPPCRCCPRCCRARCCRSSTPRPSTGDLAELDLSGAWAVASADDDAAPVERREGVPGTLGGRGAAAATTTRRPPTTRFDGRRRRLGRGAVVALRGGGRRLRRRRLRAVPGRAVLRHEPQQPEPRQRRRCGWPSCGPSTGTAIVDAVYADLADPLPTIVPAGVVGNDPDRCPECAYDPDAAADIVRPRLTPTARCRPSASTSTSRTPSRRWPRWWPTTSRPSASPPSSGRCRSRSTRTSWSPATSSSSASAGSAPTRSPDAYLAPLFGSAANDNLTNYRSVRVDGLLRRLARARRRRGQERRSAGPAPRPTSCEAAVVVPIAQFRTQVVVADRVEGLTNAVDGTVDWAQVQLAD